jgi:hypothetical protein
MKPQTLTDLCLLCTPHVHAVEEQQSAALVSNLLDQLTQIQINYQESISSRKEKLRDQDIHSTSTRYSYRLG